MSAAQRPSSETLVLDWRHGVAMHGAPALAADFAHFPHADPEARPGGALRLGVLGAFDSLNPFTLGGSPLWAIRHNVVESLMARNFDEPFSLYGLLAKEVALPDDRSWVAFRLNPAARFSNGAPVTVDDVIFSFETLRDKGRPNHRFYYGQVDRVERLGPLAFRFVFKKPDRELPLLMGLMPVLSAADWRGVDFQKNGFRPIRGSGPYLLKEVDPGRQVTFRRNPEYWGRATPAMTGRHQIDRLQHLYFRDAGAIWEAFKAGDLDLFIENDPLRWRDGYGFPAAEAGRVRRREIPLVKPSGMEGFVFNTRRPLFQDRRVRRALALAFDYNWVNRTYYAGQMKRITSFFSGSALGFTDPAPAPERALLEPFAETLPREALQRGWRPPRYEDARERRAALIEARALLREAGWSVRDGVLRNATGALFEFEILIDQRRHERVARSFADDLEWLGVRAVVRLVDQAQRTQRARIYDYDMLVFRWNFSLSPGQEQKYYFGAALRDEPGTRNYMGMAEPAVDAMVDALLSARDRPTFETAVRAYDRALSWGVFVIPWGWRTEDWIAHDAVLRIPERTASAGFILDAVWRADVTEADAARADATPEGER